MNTNTNTLTRRFVSQRSGRKQQRPECLRRLLCLLTSSFGKLAGLTLALTVIALPARADVVAFDDQFDDNELATNANGIGSGFTSFISTPFGQDGNTYARETNGLAQLSSSINAAQRESIVSKDSVAINAGGTLFEFRGVSFTNQPANGGAPNTDRLFVGVGNTGPIADDFFESGADNMPSGFWIQFMSDSIVTGSGNGSFSGTSTLFYKAPAIAGVGARTALASWTFDTLFWDDSGTPPNNYGPVLNITLTLGAESWALNITGDTTGSNPISFSGTYAGSGIDNALNDGLNPTHFGAFNQTEAPGIIMSIDRMVATLDGDLIVTTPKFLTPHYGFNTNQVRTGEEVTLSSTVISTGTPTLQWQIENSAAPGTFTNIPSATATNLSVNTESLGDSLARGLRLLATQGGNSVTSAVVTLTVNPPVSLALVQDTTPPGPEIRNAGLTYALTASFDGNLPITYNWQKSPNGSTWTNIPNATNSTYLIPSLALGDTGYYRLFATNSEGNLASTASQLTVMAGAVKYLWSLPMSFVGLNADQILTTFPNTKIAGAMLTQNGVDPVTVTLSSGSPIAFARPNTWATLAGGTGFGGGAFPGTNVYTTTGNAQFNTCLNNFYSDGDARTITMNGLVVGQQYSVQLFALDGRGGTLNPPAILRTANYQDPADPTDSSATFTMADFVYVVGTFYASNTTETIQQNLLNNGAGNFNCMVLRAIGWNPPPYITRQPQGGGAYLGGSATLSGAAAGDSTIPNPTITYQWKSGPAGGPYTNLVAGGKYTGVTTGSLTINNLTANDGAAVYVLTASNGGGSTTSSEAIFNLMAPPTPILLGHWLSGSPVFTDAAGHVPAGTHDGTVSGAGTVYHFTNDVPPGASGTNALYLGGNVAIGIDNTSLSDAGYMNTFDDTISERFSVIFWAKGYPPGTWGPAFIGKRGEDNVGWQIRRLSGNGNPGFTLRGTAGADDPNGSIAVDTNSWHHYAATWDGFTGVRRFYVDGRLALDLTGDTGLMALASGFRLMLGARESNVPGTPEAIFTGTLYDVRIYNYALSQAEVGTIGGVPPVPLTFQSFGDNQLVFTWPYGTLVESTNVLGPWTTVTATSPYTNDLTGAQKFFRTRNP
jgi:hypothetical protein